jgi:hypothetical protein
MLFLLDQWQTRDTGWDVRDTTFRTPKYTTKIAKKQTKKKL